MSKQNFILPACIFICMQSVVAQNIGILPISGIRYFKEGIWAKSIEVKVDGSQLLNNKVPLNKEIEISLVQPTGFIADKTKSFFAAAEYNLISAKGELLLKTPNLLLLYEAKGFTLKDFKTLSLKFAINEEMMKYNSSGTIMIRLYDLKGKNQLRLEFPINTIRYSEKLVLANTVKPVVKLPPTVMALVNGVKISNIRVFLDTSIKVSPTMAYTSLEISGIQGTSLGGIFQGKESFWVYDKNLNEIKISDILLKEVGGAMENNDVSYTLKIPFRLKKAPAKGYFIRFRWESSDKSQVIDVVLTL